MAELALDTVIDGKYRILRPIGEGGMGAVYVAEHLFLRKHVALKVLRAELATNLEVGARFLREARAASVIEHENVVRVLDFGNTPSGQPYLVMELLQGRPLADELAERPQASIDRALAVADGILRGLEAAHAQGVVHRDLKPDNVFLAQRQGEVIKLVDFGIASVREEGGTRLTATGAVLGTPLYMAPEQVRGDQPDARVDLHAVGVILYEMIAGRTPYQGATFGAIAHEILNGNPPSLRSVAPHVPPALDAIVMRALASSPDERYPSAAEMRQALDQYPFSQTKVRASQLTDVRPPTDPRPVAMAETVATPSAASRRPPSTTPAALEEPPATIETLELDRPAPPPAAPARATSTRGRGALVGALVALVLVGGGVAAWLTMRTREPPLPASVSIRVLNLPPGARVYLDNTRTEPTFVLPGERVPHRLRIEARGYVTRLDLVTPDSDQTIDGKLERAR